MNFDNYFKVTINLVDNPIYKIEIFKKELEYEILKLWNSIRINYYLSSDQVKILDNFNYEIHLKNDRTDCFYVNLGNFCKLIMKSFDLFHKEIIEKEKILKRKLK